MKNIHSKSLAYLLFSSAFFTNSYATSNWDDKPHWNGSVRVLHKGEEINVLDFVVYEDVWEKGENKKWYQRAVKLPTEGSDSSSDTKRKIMVSSNANLKVFGMKGNEYYPKETNPFNLVKWEKQEVTIARKMGEVIKNISYPKMLTNAEQSLASLVGEGGIRKHPLVFALNEANENLKSVHVEKSKKLRRAIKEYSRIIDLKTRLKENMNEGKLAKKELDAITETLKRNSENLDERESLSQLLPILKSKLRALATEVGNLTSALTESERQIPIESIENNRKKALGELNKLDRIRRDLFLRDQNGFAAGEVPPEAGAGEAKLPIRPIRESIAKVDSDREKVEYVLRWDFEIPLLESVQNGIRNMRKKHGSFNLTPEKWEDKYLREITIQVSKDNSDFIKRNPAVDAGTPEWLDKNINALNKIADLTKRHLDGGNLIEENRVYQAKARAMGLERIPGGVLSDEQKAFLVIKNEKSSTDHIKSALSILAGELTDRALSELISVDIVTDTNVKLRDAGVTVVPIAQVGDYAVALKNLAQIENDKIALTELSGFVTEKISKSVLSKLDEGIAKGEEDVKNALKALVSDKLSQEDLAKIIPAEKFSVLISSKISTKKVGKQVKDKIAGLDKWYIDLKTRQKESRLSKLKELHSKNINVLSYLGRFSELFENVTEKFVVGFTEKYVVGWFGSYSSNFNKEKSEEAKRFRHILEKEDELTLADLMSSEIVYEAVD